VKLPGYCTECHRVRQVNVSGHQMAMVAVGRSVEGVCDECVEKRDEPRRRR
jgi:hypothetical protein